MKLRVRSLESKETIKIQTPSPCSLQDLKNTISENISRLPEAIHLSLNRKDELDSSPNDSLQSLGITSGDLIFYTLNPNGFSGGTLIQTPRHESPPVQVSNRSGLDKKTVQQTRDSSSHMNDFHPDESLVPNPEKDETLPPYQQQEETLAPNPQEGETLIDSDDMDVDESVLVAKFSVPCFLRKVFNEEVGKDEGNSKLLIIAVHAVLLESGFVRFDPATKNKIEGFSLPEGWESTTTNVVSILYTVSDLINSDAVETVALKFQICGKFVIVYGSLTPRGLAAYRLCLDASRFFPSINFVWKSCNSNDDLNERDGFSKSSSEKEIFDFWKIVKDGLALPLLIDLCDKTGLSPPPCFMRLPTELKMRILELLPGLEIAKSGIVCSELRYLSSNSDLWKQKCAEEFEVSDVDEVQGGSYWKERFVLYWQRKNRRFQPIRKRPFSLRRPPNFGYPYFAGGMEPYPFGCPGVVGGDYDRLPGLGVPVPFGSRRDFLRFPARRNFSPHCNLGGFDV